MNTYEFLDTLNDQVFAHVMTNMREVNATQLGLDARAGHQLFIDDMCVAINRAHDRNLQYYGGFEYIDKSLRETHGNYVFYFVNDDDEYCRVRECLDRFNNVVEETQ